MPRKDKVHQTVKECLISDGWEITHDPYYIKALEANYEVDLGAEKLIAAEKGVLKIAIEVKSFLQPSFAHEFHGILGQYLNYAALLSVQEPERILYLAVPNSVYIKFFKQPSIQFVINTYNIKLVIYDSLNRDIEQWI